MSLINQMLRDLESRRTPELPSGEVLPGSTRESSAGFRHPLVLLLITTVVLLVVAVIYLLQRGEQVTSHAAQPPSNTMSNTKAGTTSDMTAIPVPISTAQQDPIQPEQAPTTSASALVLKPPHTPQEHATPERPARLNYISPSVIDGSWQQRTLTLRGESFHSDLRVVVNWGNRSKVLPPERVEWLDATTARIQLVTGDSDEVWRVALLQPDGSQGNSVEFEVIASSVPDAGRMGSSDKGEMKKTIHPLSSTEQAENLYLEGYHALQQRKSDVAEKLWLEALSVDPIHNKSREGLIALYLSQSRKVEASKLLEEGTVVQPENPQFALLYARLLVEQGETTAAIATLEGVMGQTASAPELYALLAALYQQQKDYDRSIHSYQRALQQQPQQANWWMGLGISLEGAGKTVEARSAYEEALKRGMTEQLSLNYVQQRLNALK